MPTTRIRARRTTEEVEVEIESEPGRPPARIPADVYQLLPSPLSLPQLLDAIDLLVDQRVASELSQPHLDRLLDYTDQVRQSGADPTLIEDYVRDRAQSLWDRKQASKVHELTEQLRT